ncbi:MAG: hemagglutinin repeat-containing protein, partial [Helicobacteraceae bacterium]|nr:hemagglutinin repeat-containing protein [Helicobacteraceae bacterium]
MLKTRPKPQISFLLSLCLIFSQALAPLRAASIELDPNSKTSLDKAQNGVDLIQIARPNNDGVSRNTYSNFNIDKQGAIFNNSDQLGVSKLGGALMANPNFQANDRALVILNEVTSNKRSDLKGYAEVFGSKAELIIANPNGITCDGCGFINASRASLIVGGSKPGFDDLRFNMGDKELLIGALGLDARESDSVDLVAKVHRVTGEILGSKRINIYAGNEEFDYATKAITSLLTQTSDNQIGLAIDASALGSMYAGSIKIVSTDAGFGVKSDAALVALADDLEILADGSLQLKDAYAAKTALIAATDTQTNGTLYASDLVINADSLAHSGTLQAKNVLALSAETIDNEGVIVSETKTDIRSDALNNVGSIGSLDRLSIATQALNNRGVIAADATVVSTDRLENDGGILAADALLDVRANTHDNAGEFRSSRDLIVSFGSDLAIDDRIGINGGKRSVIELSGNNLELKRDYAALGSLYIKGANKIVNDSYALAAKEDLTIDALALYNQNRAALYSEGDLYLNAVNLYNTGDSVIYGRQSLRVDRDGERADLVLNDGSRIFSGGGLYIASSDLINRYLTGANAYDRVYSTQYILNQTKSVYADAATLNESERSVIRSSEDMELNVGSLTNNLSYIQSGGDIYATGETFANISLPLYASKYIVGEVTRSKEEEYCKIKIPVVGCVQYGHRTKTWQEYFPLETVAQTGSINSYIQAAGTISGSISNLENGASSDVSDIPVVSDLSFGQYADNIQSIAANEGFVDPLSLIGGDKAIEQGDLNALYALNRNQTADRNYLIESRAAFTDVDKLLGSSYFFDRIGYVPQSDVKRLGDNLVEQRLVLDAIGRVSPDYLARGSDEEIFNALLENGVSAALALELQPGVSLADEQIAVLTNDIIWYEFVYIGGQSVLAPKVYLGEASRGRIAIENGAIIEADVVDFFIADGLSNSGVIKAEDRLSIASDGTIANINGTIKSGGSLRLSASDILNQSSVNPLAWLYGVSDPLASILGENVYLSANGDIKNVGGSIASRDLLSISAQGDYINQSTTNSFAIGQDRYEVISQIASTTAEGALNVMTGGSIIDGAGAISAGGDARLSAQESVVFDSVALRNSRFYGQNGYAVTENSTTNETSALNIGGNLRIEANDDALFYGTKALVGGDVDLQAGSLLITSVANETDKTSVKSSSSSSILGSSSKKTVKSERSLINDGSEWNVGGSMNADIADGVFVYGSFIKADQEVNLIAGGDLAIVSAVDSQYEQSVTKKKNVVAKSGSDTGSYTESLGKAGIWANDVALDAKGDIIISAANLNAKNNLNIGSIVVAKDETGSALTDAKGGYISEDGRSLDNLIVNSVALRDESWDESYWGLRGALKTVVAGAAFYAGAYGLEFDITTDRSNSERRSIVERSSSNLAADNIALRSDGNVVLEAANIQAIGSVSIAALNDITIASAAETAQTSESSSRSAITGGGVEVSSSRASISVTGTQTDKSYQTQTSFEKASVINAGAIDIVSGSDVNILGSIVDAANTLSIDAANNINILSAEEIAIVKEELNELKTKLSIGVGNSYNDAYIAVANLSEAVKAVDEAKRAYDEAKRDPRINASDLKFYETNIAVAVANLAQATTAVAAAGAKAAASSETGGFYADASMEVKGTQTVTEQTRVSNKASSLSADALSLNAGGDITVEGSVLTANQAVIAAVDNINISASKNAAQSSTQTKEVEASVSVGTAGVGVSGGGGFSMASDRSNYYQNSLIQVGDLSLYSGGDTVIKGASLIGDNISLTVGGDFSLISLQDSSFGYSQGSNANIGSSGSSSLSANAAKYSDNWVNNQTSIIAA